MTGQINPSRLTSRLIRIIGDRIAPPGRGEGRLCILNYHRVLPAADPLLDSEPDVQAFHWQMECLAECFNVMPLHEAVECLAKERMPPRAVSISFDDGYRSIHDEALPILKKFGLPATVFVTSGYVDGGLMWNDQIIDAVKYLPQRELDLRDMGLGVHPLDRMSDRKAAMNSLTAASKYLPPYQRDELTRKLKMLVGESGLHDPMLTRDMMCNLANQDIEIGAHTVTHPILTSLDEDSAWREISISKQHIESITGKPTRLFAYPNGKFGVDFDARHVQMAMDAGFDAAFTTAPGAAKLSHHRFQLPRGRPWDATPTRFGLRLLRWLAG